MTTAVSLKAQQSAVTRKAILDACLKLFARHGFSTTSIDDIASAAGITKGAVYWHFENKEELFQAILEEIRARWVESVQQPLSEESAPVKRLAALFDCYSRLFAEAPEICLFLQRILLENHKEFSPQVARVFAQTARFIARIIDDGKARGMFRRDLDSIVTAHMILGSLSGATQQSLANRSLTLTALLGEAKSMTMARISRLAFTWTLLGKERPRNEHPNSIHNIRSVSRSAAMSMKADLELSIRLRPKNVRTCYVCGPDNARGLQVAFLADGAHGSRALYTARPEHEGWPGLLHGGVTFSLMDEALGWAVHFQGLYGVTARIDTRFRRPIPIGMRVVIKAWTIDRRRRIATARAEVRAEAEGQSLLAEADATIFLQESENQK